MLNVVMRIVAVCVLGTLLGYLLPSGGMKRSAEISLRLIALLCVAQIVVQWVV